MRGTAARVALLVSVAIALVAAGSASAAPVPGDCQNDRKLIGPIWVSTVVADDGKTSWWELTRAGMLLAGYTDPEATVAGWFGLQEADDAIEALVAAVAPLDKNGNGFVCATSATGTKAFIGDPNYAYYYFGVQDDKHVKA